MGSGESVTLQSQKLSIRMHRENVYTLGKDDSK